MSSPPCRPSALVTTFNHERFIGLAIESLLEQDERVCEIIVVDDGSQDRTVEIASRYADRGVTLLQTPHLGPSLAMNIAMSRASGDVFIIQSGDDASKPCRVSRQLKALETFDLCASIPELIDDDGHVLDDASFATFFRMASQPSMEDLFTSLYVDGNFLCASSIAIRRSVWERLGGFHPGLLQLQDYDYWLRALVSGFTLSISQERLISYRIHSNNLSDRQNDVRTQRELASIIRNIGPDTPEGFLLAVLYKDMVVGVPWTPADRKMLLALFYLRHPSELVRQAGIDGLIDIMGDAAAYETMQNRFGISRQTIFNAFLHR